MEANATLYIKPLMTGPEGNSEFCFPRISMFPETRFVITGGPHKQCVCLCLKYKEMYGRILKSLNMVNLYREMFKLKLKINVKVPQLLCIVVSVALNGRFERFGGFCVDCCLSFNLNISRYQFTILRFFNILPYISLYLEHKQTHCLCGRPVLLYSKTKQKQILNNALRFQQQRSTFRG